MKVGLLLDVIYDRILVQIKLAHDPRITFAIALFNTIYDTLLSKVDDE